MFALRGSVEVKVPYVCVYVCVCVCVEDAFCLSIGIHKYMYYNISYDTFFPFLSSFVSDAEEGE